MIAGRHGDDAAVAFVRAKRRHFVVGAAVLEGARDLEVLELHIDIGARHLGKLGCAKQGRAHDIALEGYRRFFDVPKGYRHATFSPSEGFVFSAKF
jgi:hypothetical protein